MAAAQPLTPQLIERFCEVLANTGIVSRAIEDLSLNRATVYGWRKENAGFRALWDASLEIGIGKLEDEVKRRAFEGTLKPVFQGGEEVGQVREYSDSLAMFVLKGRLPEVYRDRQDLNVSGTLGIAEVLAKARKRASPPNPEDEV
jgi:hypothetical protein